ncbi:MULTISPECIES: penicillin-binding transpeptidase domain-containing protein [unclassified Pseudodesulfovibrio]|uniref:penicillin-binding transpeptidase domain-containing protein n=1 Tax=unclassified Pseudodesulfovibrio TaxID=2661612 RepID=UPI000FEC1D8D|nr:MULTISPECIES: penicillin-binding transpeptidase domain-containing protein [unclassified Pseudodesulfovibrio]MCJ2164896.1 PASTA domain-containing protein [Pseudodesulfovibrio sp. S3-i]RWU03739.1 PASTA domain-containing protein [Pseudodesulfovibrio sp. S3]
MAKDSKGRTDHSGIKIGFVMTLFSVALCALWVRAGWIQLHEGDILAEMASRQSLAAEYEYGERGRIFDRNGQMLATSVEAKSIFIRPYEIENIDVAADVLSRDLKLSRSSVYRKLKSSKKFIWIKRQVTDREAAAVVKADVKGIRLTSEFSRIYPNGHLAGQLLGFVDIDGRGREGIEYALNDRLTPGKAEFVVQRDAMGRHMYLDAHGREVDINGLDVRLTIDTHIQHAAEQALANSIAKYDAKAGIVMVVDVKSGDILAMANQPFFNPNTVRASTPAQRRLRSLTDIYEPGSSMKPFLFAAALEENVITPDTLIDCENGRWTVARKVIRDTHPARWLPAHKVLRYSSNIGSAKIGMDLGAGVYYDYLSKLGFGEKTNIGLPGESVGILMPPSKWTSVDLAAISFGQAIGVTALQMARAFLCIANQGATKELNLIKFPATDRKNATIQIFRPETTAAVLSMMKDVVHEDGTGRSALIEGITMAGKTGTAQKASKNGGYGNQYLSSFVALVPAEEPELLVITMIDEPQKANYGSMVAAPVCREVTVRTLAYHGQLSETLHANVEESVSVDGLENEPLNQTMDAPMPQTVTDKVPDIEGMPVRRALELLAKMGIVPVLKGQGMTVKRQQPSAGLPWPGNRTKEGADDVFVLWLS